MKAVYKALCCLIMITLFWAPLAYGQGKIEGTVQLKLENGTLAFADWVRVLLTTGPADIPAVPDLTVLNAYDKMETIRNLHMVFFIRVREQMSQPDYVVNSTLTTPEGTFRFTDVAPGNYFVIVTFPAMIDDYKVAWQIPVKIQENEVVSLFLNNDNMAVPTYTRTKRKL